MGHKRGLFSIVLSLSFSTLFLTGCETESYFSKSVTLNSTSNPPGSGNPGNPSNPNPNPSATPPVVPGLTCTVDSYKQPDLMAVNKFDLLFVTDTSSSLDAERAGIAQGIDSFVSKLPAGADYQISVMLGHGSTSSYNGELFGATVNGSKRPEVLKSSVLTANQIRTYLGDNLVKGPGDNNSDGGEEGLYSLYQGITTKLAKNKGKGFFRDDAALAIVFIADENDICAQYPAGVTPVVDGNGVEPVAKARDCSGITVQKIYTELKNIQGSRPLLISGIVYSDLKTVPSGGENEYGYGYIDLISLSNSKPVDMALGNYAAGLATIGDLAIQKVNLLTEFLLKTPNVVQNTISVNVDNKMVPFTYVPAINEVQISASDAGGPQSNVIIDYCW